MSRTLWSAHVSTLFTEHAPEDRPAAAARAGFGFIDSWWPPAPEPDRWAEAVRRAGVGVACLNADGGDLRRGERGFLNDPARASECSGAIARALRLAPQVSGRTVNVLAGRWLAGVSRRRQWDAAVTTLRDAAPAAAELGIVLVVEPINARDVPGYLVPTPRDALCLIDAVGSEQVRLLYDAYHALRAGRDPMRDVAAFTDRIGHVQYAHAPDRGDPPDGGRLLMLMVERLQASGYAGTVGLEISPSRSTEATLSALAATTGVRRGLRR